MTLATRTCAIDGCEAGVNARGWCATHYSRWRHSGDPLVMHIKGQPPEVRFWAKVEKTDTCWLWTGTVNGCGYGQFRPGKGAPMVVSHRWAYTQELGPIPDGLELDHLCRQRSCVRPSHLEVVTRSENIRRGLDGRGVFRCGHAVTPENTRVASGRRCCVACAREYHRARHRRLHPLQADPSE